MKSKSWNRFLAAFMIVFALLLGACRSSAPEAEAPVAAPMEESKRSESPF